MKFILILILISINCIIYSQNSKDTKNEIMQTDIEFSQYSLEHGMNKAFLEFASESAVMLKPNSMPIVGFDKVRERIIDRRDSGITLTWKPLYSDVSYSLDLGYTYGTWLIIFKDENGIEQSGEGTYVTIWKKDNKGKWKWVLDTGNQGLNKP